MTSPDGLLLPEGARLVHIGPHKTGSTAIQVAFHESRSALSELGVHYAGTGTRPRKAGWAIGVAGRRAGTPVPPMRHWAELVRDVEAAGDRRVCVSNEDFGRATPEQAARIVRELGGDAVHVVAVARRLDGYLPSQWQERVKAGEVRSYEDWLGVVLAPESTAWDWRNVWRAHDLDQLVRRWTELVGPERFTLIVSDEADRDLLPRTFERLLGIPEGFLQVQSGRSNRGLSWAETELVRSLNVTSREVSWPKQVHDRFVKRQVVDTLRTLPGVSGASRTPPLPAWALDRVRQISDDRIVALGELRRLGVRVVGDPETMRVPDDVPVGSSADSPPLPVDTATRALSAVIGEAARDQARHAGPVPASALPSRELARLLAGRLGRRLPGRA